MGLKRSDHEANDPELAQPLITDPKKGIDRLHREIVRPCTNPANTNKAIVVKASKNQSFDADLTGAEMLLVASSAAKSMVADELGCAFETV